MIYVLFGLTAGIFSGLFGVGGGIILVPLFITFLSYNSHKAVSLSLIAMSFPVFLFSLWKHYQAGHWGFDMVKLGAMAAMGMVMGGFIGATISTKITSLMLKKSFAVVLVFVAMKLWMDKK
jgi:uncharacterized membrane protein YfcA